MSHPPESQQNLSTCLDAVEGITSERLGEALRGWRLGQLAPESLLQLPLFDAGEGSYARDVLLYDWVQTTVLARIRFYTPPGAKQLTAVTARDNALAVYQQVMGHLSDTDGKVAGAWVTLYVRWVMPEAVPVAQLAEAAHLSERHLRRLTYHAQWRLASQLRQATFAACRARQGWPMGSRSARPGTAEDQDSV